MLSQLLFTIAHALLDVVHISMYITFILSGIRVFMAKNSPYSSFYVGSVAVVQAIYNGCPVVDNLNALAERAGVEVIENSFIFELFNLNIASRVFIFIFGIILFYQSYITWFKPRSVVDFSRIIRFSSLTSFLSRMKNLETKRV